MTFWFGTTKDGEKVSELTHKWSDICDDIASLGMELDSGQIIELPKISLPSTKYIQMKTASADLNGDNVAIESRYIGFKLGTILEVRIRVDEKTNNISVELG